MAASSKRTPCIIEDCPRSCNGGNSICAIHLHTKKNKLLHVVIMVKKLYGVDITTATAQAAYEQVKGPQNYRLMPTIHDWDHIYDEARDKAPWQLQL